MKISIGKTDPTVGPGIFMKRLVKSLVENHGVQIVSFKPDIFLGVVYLDGAPRGAKTVLRIDGLYWDRPRFSNNQRIFEAVRRADGVVFQSEFARSCYAKYVQCKSSCVVLNGIDVKWVKSVLSATIEPGIVSTAKWRPLKRYKSICQGFLESGVDMPLHLVGQIPPDAIRHPRIIWHGSRAPDATMSIVRACKYAIHLGQFDVCPNSVVEECAAGLLVLHTANGGAPEIVKGQGVRLPVDEGWDFGILPGITEVDHLLVAEHINKLVGQDTSSICDRMDLDIKESAAKYYEFFKRILGQ